MDKLDIKGSKIAELAYLSKQLNGIKTNNVLIVGERDGAEGVTAYTLNAMTDDQHLTLTDITPVEPGSYVDDLFKTRKNLNFILSDFINFNAEDNIDVIVCISVLEHFGMKFDEMDMFDDGTTIENDIIHWNHDLLGLENMMLSLRDGGKIIVTVPAGRYMNYDKNGYPFLRYYTEERREIIKKLVDNFGCKLTNEEWAISYDFKEWFRSDVRVMGHCVGERYRMNSFTPNGLWNFCIEHK